MRGGDDACNSEALPEKHTHTHTHILTRHYCRARAAADPVIHEVHAGMLENVPTGCPVRPEQFLMTLRAFPPAHPETTPKRVEVTNELWEHRGGQPNRAKEG